MSLDALKTEVDALERAVAAARREVLEKRRERDELEAREARLRDLLAIDGEGRRPRAGPLAAILLSTGFALATAVATYILGLLFLGSHGIDSDWGGGIAAWLAGLGLTVATYLPARKPGAGGSARRLLRALVRMLLAACFLAGVFIVVLALLR